MGERAGAAVIGRDLNDDIGKLIAGEAVITCNEDMVIIIIIVVIVLIMVIYIVMII